MILYPCQNFLGEELPYVFGRNGMEGVIDRYAYSLLAIAHAEGAAERYAIAKMILCDQVLKLRYYLTRALDVARASDANRNFKHNILPLSTDDKFLTRARVTFLHNYFIIS